MARKPVSVHRGKTKQQLVDQLNKQTLESYGDYGKARERLGAAILADIDWWYEAAKLVVLMPDMSDRQARYLMIKAMLDKVAPDRREHARADVSSKTAPVLIQVNGLARGTVEAREAAQGRAAAVTVDAE